MCWSEPNSQQAVSDSEHGNLTERKSSENKSPSDNLVAHQQPTNAVTGTVDAATQKKQTKQDSTAPDNSFWWFQCLLVIFTGLLAGVGIFQVIIIFKTLKATTLAAEAARKAADVSEKALTVGERAYLIIDQFSVTGDFAENRVMKIFCKIINTGRTPAIITEIFGEVQVVERVPVRPIYGDSIKADRMIGSGAEHSITMAVGSLTGITAEMQLKVFQKRLMVFVHGRICYLDIFKQPHETGFFAMWDHANGEFFAPRNIVGYNFWT